jgi:hypothetical protein
VAARDSSRTCLLLFPIAAMAACKLCKLYGCEDSDAGECGEVGHHEVMLGIDGGRSLKCVFGRCVRAGA